MDRNILLIVDDVALNRMLLRNVFEGEYNILEAENGEQALFLIQQYQDSIAAILLDIVMPVKGGYEVLEAMKRGQLIDKLPVIVVTSRGSSDDEVRAFDLGAADIVAKPFEPHVVSRRVHNAVELSNHRRHLEQLVEEQSISLQQSTDVLVDALSSVIEHRSAESGQHVLRIRMFTKVLLEDIMRSYPEYGLSDYEIAKISSAAALHDVGKIAIPDAILNKPGPLTKEEFDIMKTHAEKGGEILSVLEPIHDKKYLKYAYDICMYHHERWDGKGYPKGLAGEDIPICAQVVGVADAYDALTTERVYKAAYTPETAFRMILNGECGQFPPRVLESLKNTFLLFTNLTRQYADGGPVPINFEKRLPGENAAVARLSTLELGQAKYFAMLRYGGATVIEADLDTGIFHITYKQNSDFDLFSTDGSFCDAYNNFIQQRTHPEGRSTFEANAYFQGFVESGSMKQSLKYRVKRRAGGGYTEYEATVLRVAPENPAIHKIIVIWKEIPSGAAGVPEPRAPRLMVENTALVAMVQCVNDQWATITEINSGFTALLGYSKEEMSALFENHYRNLIVAEDQEAVVKHIRRRLDQENIYEMEYRVRAKDGRSLWVLDRSQLFQGQDGIEYINSILTDITKAKHEQEELRLSIERHQIIMDQTNDIIFEWDIRKNQISYSPNWEKKYGYTPISEGNNLCASSVYHIHPEDIPGFLSMADSIASGAPYGEAEVRIANADGRYIWNRLRATTQFDQGGKPAKAVGVILDIDGEKQRLQHLVDKAERDSLTGLFNKEATERRIQHILEHSEPGCMSAMMIIDLDNFKLVNDTFGHLFGDAVLAEVATQLRLFFRPGDILSRIGGDEFLVYMNDISSKNGVCNRADQMITGIRGILREKMGNCDLSCSVGIAYFPEDARQFQDLFLCCDRALYQAKARGKNQYALFDRASMDRQPGSVHQPPLIATTHIESAGNYDLDTADMIQRALQILCQMTDMEKAVQSVVELLGQTYQVSRAYVFEDTNSGPSHKNVYEWCAKGVSPLRDRFQRAPGGPFKSSLFDEHGLYLCTDIDALPETEREAFRALGVNATLRRALYDSGKIVGFIGLDSARKMLWTQSQIHVISFLSEWLSAFLMKKRAQDTLANIRRSLRSLLDAQNLWICVVDPHTHILKYINAYARRSTPNAKAGMPCYRAFLQYDAPCGQCPMQHIHREGKEPMEIYNPVLDIWTLADASPIQWDGEDACLLTCQNVTKYKKRGNPTDRKANPGPSGKRAGGSRSSTEDCTPKAH